MYIYTRGEFPRTSFAKLQEQLEDTKNSVTTVKEHGKLDIQLSTSVVASSEKASDSNSSVDELIQSPSGSREHFLEDIVNVNSPDPKFSFDSTNIRSEHNDQPADAPACSKEVLANLHHELNSGINEEFAAAHPSICKETEDVHEEHILIDVSASENAINQGDGVSVNCSAVGPQLPADNALVYQDEHNFTTKVSDSLSWCIISEKKNVLS